MATTALRSVAPAKLSPDPGQVRRSFDKNSLRSLADNLKARGVLQPILARQSGRKLIIVDGERRWRAAKLAKLKTVPVMVIDAGDDVQRKLDQVAVNSLREGLKPLELGRLLVTLRQQHKLSDNEIAAHLDKQGIPALSKGQMLELMQLVDLPDWAKVLVDNGELDPKAAPVVLQAEKDKPIAKVFQKAISQEGGLGGHVSARAAERVLSYAYSGNAGADLNKTHEYYSDPVRFNPTIACKGCEHLRQANGQKYCMNRKHFDQLQAEAREAGLGPGGKKPTPASKGSKPKASKKAQALAAEQKAKSRTEKLADYLDQQLRQRLITEVLPNDPVLRSTLSHYLAAGMPHGFGWDGSPNLLLGAHDRRDSLPHLERAVAKSGLTDLIAFLHGQGQLLEEMAKASQEACLHMLRREQVHALARHLKVDLAAFYVVDEAYLKLHQKAEVQRLAELGGVEDPHKLTAKVAIERILESTVAKRAIGVPSDLQALYDQDPDKPPQREVETMTCIGCGCTEDKACDDGGEPCHWLRQDSETNEGVCSACPDALADWDDVVQEPTDEEDAAA